MGYNPAILPRSAYPRENREGVVVDVWTPEMLRSLPPESMPQGTTVTFVGGLMDGKTKQIALATLDGPLPFGGYERGGRHFRHIYTLSGWRPDPGVWIYTLSGA